MVNVTPDVIKALQQIGLKVYDEGFLTKDTEMPCISIMEYDNKADIEGAGYGYSEVIYHIKVWSTKQSEIAEYSKKVDSTMRSIGFRRQSSNDLIQNSIRQRKLKYFQRFREKF